MHKKVFSELFELKKILDTFASKDDILDDKLCNILYSRFITASSIIEGVELKKSDVTQIIKTGRKAKILQGNPREDFLQAYGQKKVLDLIEKWAKEKKPISVTHLLEIHRVFFGTVSRQAGAYRMTHVKLAGSSLLPSLPFVIQADMHNLDHWLLEEQKRINKDDVEAILCLVAKSYHEITRIHPFEDGNGRSARLFVALLLRRYGLPHIIIPKVVNAKETRTALRAADMGDLDPLTQMMAKFLEESLETVLAYWKRKSTFTP